MTNEITPEIIGWAQAAERRYGVPAAMNIATAIWESQLGGRTPPGSNNWHGIKGLGPPTDTREQTAGGVWYTIKAGFHMFDSPADSFMYYAWLISTGAPYAAAWKQWLASPKKNADVETLTRAISARYASSLLYARDLVSVEEQDQLFGYDKLPAPAPAPASPASAGAAPVKGTTAMPGPGISPAQNPAAGMGPQPAQPAPAAAAPGVAAAKSAAAAAPATTTAAAAAPGVAAAQSAAAAAPATTTAAVVTQAASGASAIAAALGNVVTAAAASQPVETALQEVEGAVSTALVNAATAFNPIAGVAAEIIVPEAMTVVAAELAGLFTALGRDVPNGLAALLAKL
jgi:hypothetical protein